MNTGLHWIAMIPARFGSSRFPGKPLAEINGKSMLAHVIAHCREANPAEVVVATDHPDIAKEAERNGAVAVMTPENCPTGTLRCLYAWSEVKERFPQVSCVVNVQGDEPGLQPENLTQLVEQHKFYPTDILTLFHTLPLPDNEAIYADPNKVKVVSSASGIALYFSRSPIPFARFGLAEFKLHVGVYAFPVSLIPELLQCTQGTLSEVESLEQLAWIEAGLPLRLVEEIRPHAPGIDTPADLERFINQSNTESL